MYISLSFKFIHLYHKDWCYGVILMPDVTLRTNLLFVPFDNANVHSFFYGPFVLQIIISTHTTVLLFSNVLFSPVLALFDGGYLLNFCSTIHLVMKIVASIDNKYFPKKKKFILSCSFPMQEI